MKNQSDANAEDEATPNQIQNYAPTISDHDEDSSLFDNIRQLPSSSNGDMTEQKGSNKMQKMRSNQDQLLPKRKDDMLLNIADNKLKDKIESAENIQDKSKKIPKSEIGD